MYYGWKSVVYSERQCFERERKCYKIAERYKDTAQMWLPPISIFTNWIWNTGCCRAIRGCWWAVWCRFVSDEEWHHLCGVCVCIKSSCAQFKCERSARNPTTKQGVRVCGGNAWWDAQQLQCFFPVSNTCERPRVPAKLSGLSMCPLEQLIMAEKTQTGNVPHTL